MKKILIAFISLFMFFACANEVENEENNEEQTSHENLDLDGNLEDDLGELEEELSETDSIKEN